MRRIILKTVLLCAILLGINTAWSYYNTDDSESYTRLMMHEMYTQKENIDIAFMGASHTYRSISPKVADDITGKNTFNLGSSNQLLDITYYLLKEVLKENSLETVYLELNYIMLRMADKNDVATFLITDYMKPSWNKMSCILACTMPADYVNGFSKARRNVSVFTTEIVEKKAGKSYKDFEYIDYGNEMYDGKGFVYSRESLTENYEQNYRELTEDYLQIHIDEFSQRQLEYLDRIIKLCQRENIELVLFTAPMPQETVEACRNYEDFLSFVDSICEENSLQYYDFNKEHPLSLGNELFKDDNHLNGEGAEVFTRYLIEIGL